MATSREGEVIENWIAENLDGGRVVKQSQAGASSWSSAYVYRTQTGKKYFVKVSRNRDSGMFEGEALGLQALYDTNSMRIPKIYHFGSLSSVPEGKGQGKGSFIIMEYLDFGSSYSQADLGRALAEMHKAEPADETAKKGMFGFPIDNTIGGTSQPNGWMDNWVDFYRERRLNHQLKLSKEPNLQKLGKKLCDNLERFFQGIEVKPSVLHGDLWSGNISGVDGQPSIFDPAVYYGHSEADFGMSWCAGFRPAFYEAYHKVLPQQPGFADRKQLYLLYHYLNHYNLFGGGYYSSAESILRELTNKI
ncbi:hypothetical protein ABBQ32_002455 [Trebouxia sp. C0010 RCD-2024]